MDLSLGVDTGGTYTDAVVVSCQTKEIIACAKALTTPENLFLGISSAISRCLEDISLDHSLKDIRKVCLSTTLATNAITEGYGGRVCEFMIGYDRQLLVDQGFMKEMVTDDIVWLIGGHDIQGNETAPLDESTAESEILKRAGKVEAFAVSGYFSTRNPDHEKRIKEKIKAACNKPVTCAHELTTRLNAVSRAITTAHNARLIPLLKQLISDVYDALFKFSIQAPLMIVRGDGSIVPADWAMRRPIETILSGPAASCVGAGQLVAEKNVWVADMGGTTTDIALLTDGYPAIHPEGAWISSRRTMVEAVEIQTLGIGGDSRVKIDSQNQISLGPSRAIPLCLMADRHPEILKKLEEQASNSNGNKYAGQFVTARRTGTGCHSTEDAEILIRVRNSPVALESLVQDEKRPMALHHVRQMEKMALLNRVAFTPTDALHVLGRMTLWNEKASRLGAQILAHRLGMRVSAFCEKVIESVNLRLKQTLFVKALALQNPLELKEREPFAMAMLALAFDGNPVDELECRVKLKKPMVALGAPVASYMPDVAAGLNARLIIPDHAAVANAFGAATAEIVQRGRAVIRMMGGGRFFRAHLPDGVADFESLQDAIAHAEKTLSDHVKTMAVSAGAGDIFIEVTCSDHSGTLPGGKTQEQYLDTEIFVTCRGAYDCSSPFVLRESMLVNHKCGA